VPTAAAFGTIWIEDGHEPMYCRAFAEAGLPTDAA
jgi:hypothetical protein